MIEETARRNKKKELDLIWKKEKEGKYWSWARGIAAQCARLYYE